MVHHRKNLYIGVKVTQSVAQYPLHHVTYVLAKFEVATSNGLGDTFTSKYIICPWRWDQGHINCSPVPSAFYDLYPFRVWSCYVHQFRGICIYKKIRYLTKCCPVPSTACDLCTCKVWSCYVQQFRRTCIYKKMHYLTFYFGINVIWNVAQYLLHHETYVPRTLECVTCNVLGGDAFIREIHYLTFDLGLGVKVIWIVARCLLHHITYVPRKLKVATSNCLGRDAFARNTLFDLWPWLWGQAHKNCCSVPSTSCALYTNQIWSCYVLQFGKRYIYKELHYLTFDVDLGVKAIWNIAQFPLYHVICEVATINGLGEDTITRNVTDRTDRRTYRRADGQTDDGPTLVRN